jgi:uncharacterized protein with GYD domain
MTTYVVLCNFTDQGIKSVKDTVKRADAAREAAAKFGVNMRELYWVQGQYDIVSLCDAEDEHSVAAFGLALASQGNIKMQTLRAYTRDDMAAIVKKLP